MGCFGVLGKVFGEDFVKDKWLGLASSIELEGNSGCVS